MVMETPEMFVHREYRERWNAGPLAVRASSAPVYVSPWFTAQEAAGRARCSTATVRREARAGRLRSVRVGGRKSVRFRSEWIDEWLEAYSVSR